jgi:site-specific recombinase XerD
LGNWLTAGEASALWQLPDRQTLTGKRNRAILAILLGCGLRRRELAELTVESIQKREERWAIVDLVGKGRHIRTVPVPARVKETLDACYVPTQILIEHFRHRYRMVDSKALDGVIYKSAQRERGRSIVIFASHDDLDPQGRRDEPILRLDPISIKRVRRTKR